MIFSTFTEQTKGYLKSMRVLKDYVSFDVYIKSSWSIPKRLVKDIEVLPQDSSERPDHKLYAFVVKNESSLVDGLETSVKGIFDYNLEREEKEKLFKDKIQELKSMFESQDVSSLKRLYFEIDENTSLDLEEKLEEDGQTDGESDDVVQEREAEGQSRGEEV